MKVDSDIRIKLNN